MTIYLYGKRETESKMMNDNNNKSSMEKKLNK